MLTTVNKLLDMDIAVHVRSVLLQGLLLKAPQHWPDHLSLALRHHHFRWLDYLSHNGISPLAGALGFIRTCTGVEAVLCGVVSRQELSEVLQAWSQSKTHILESPEGWAWQSRLDLDPRGWPP